MRAAFACPEILAYSSTLSREERFSANSEISAPETNALPPAPLNTTTRIRSSFSNSAMISGTASTCRAIRRCDAPDVELHPADRAVLFGDHPFGRGLHGILLMLIFAIASASEAIQFLAQRREKLDRFSSYRSSQ